MADVFTWFQNLTVGMTPSHRLYLLSVPTHPARLPLPPGRVHIHTSKCLLCPFPFYTGWQGPLTDMTCGLVPAVDWAWGGDITGQQVLRLDEVRLPVLPSRLV